ncbi:hypothetical protein THIOKS13020010 [Thiocapsa sp. KS1]|nr:hypothetical protein THIOKS13020010 [Thiocapsa sp. KS1]
MRRREHTAHEGRNETGLFCFQGVHRHDGVGRAQAQESGRDQGDADEAEPVGGEHAPKNNHESSDKANLTIVLADVFLQFHREPLAVTACESSTPIRSALE